MHYSLSKFLNTVYFMVKQVTSISHFHLVFINNYFLIIINLQATEHDKILYANVQDVLKRCVQKFDSKLMND